MALLGVQVHSNGQRQIRQVHYKTNSRIISRIIRLELVVDYQPDYQLNYQQDYQPGSTEVPAW